MKFNINTFGFFLGIACFLAILLFGFSETDNSIRFMAAIAAITAIWWITEAMPLAVTSLVPVVLLPLFGVLNANSVATEYFNSTIMIYLGGFLIALAMQKWNLHKRIAMFLIRLIGTGPSKIILGFIISSAVLSMFISNIATTVMLLPIGMAIIFQLEEMFSESDTRNFSVALMLGIAYSSSIGGIATIIGTAPNLIFKRVYEMNFPEAETITFAQWFSFGFPLSILILIAAYIVLVKLLFRPSPNLIIKKEFINDEYKKLGKMRYEEIVVLVILSITAILWLTRPGLNLGFIEFQGWAGLLNFGSYIDDATVVIFTALLLFLIPTSNPESSSGRILDAKVLPKIPWDVILIFGGGFALAKGFTVSGLSDYVGMQFLLLKDVNPIFLTASINFILTFLTELTSNTATSNTILPILASISIANDINPLLLMLPATISASMAFMLPVATPPNAIVYGSGKIKVRDMIKAGIILNFIGIILITGLFYTLGAIVYGF